MAGRWEQTRTPGIYVQEGPRGKRYKAAFRDARGVVTSKTFPRIGQAQDFLAEKRQQRRTNTLPDVSKGARTMSDLWEPSPRPTGASPRRSPRMSTAGAITSSPPSGVVALTPCADPTSKGSTPT